MLHANCTDQITWPRLHRVTRGAHTLGASMLCLWRCGSRGCQPPKICEKLVSCSLNRGRHQPYWVPAADHPKANMDAVIDEVVSPEDLKVTSASYVENVWNTHLILWRIIYDKYLFWSLEEQSIALLWNPLSEVDDSFCFSRDSRRTTMTSFVRARWAARRSSSTPGASSGANTQTMSRGD